MASTDPHRPASLRSFSRRGLVGSSLAAAAVWRLGAAPALGAWQEASSDPTTWRTWLLDAVDELRPAAPADPTPTEIDKLLDYQGKRTDDTAATWRAGAVGRRSFRGWRWDSIWLVSSGSPDRVLHAPKPCCARPCMTRCSPPSMRKEPIRARCPSVADPRLTPMEGVDTDAPSFPSLHAAVAGAAGAVLPYLFPDAEAGRFEPLVEEAATSRLWAGANYPSDVEAGLALGQAIGERAVARGKADGSDAKWDGSGRLTGEGTWEPTPPKFVENPVEPLGGTWQTWVLPSGDAVRPAPPPAYGSPLWQAQLEAVQEATSSRTLEQVRIVQYWDDKGPFRSFTEYALDLIERDGLDDAHTARALALMSVAQADAVIAVWDSKYTWWTERPITADPDLDMLLPTPPYPSYPSGFSAVVGSAAVVLGHLFPRAEVDLLASAAEAAAQRCWSGIHFPIDDDIGLEMGYQVGRLVNTVARDDGAE